MAAVIFVRSGIMMPGKFQQGLHAVTSVFSQIIKVRLGYGERIGTSYSSGSNLTLGTLAPPGERVARPERVG